MILAIFLGIFGLVGILKGSFKITSGREITENAGRICGLILLSGAAAIILNPKVALGTYTSTTGATYPIQWDGVSYGWLTLGIAIILGLASSKLIDNWPGKPRRLTWIRIRLVIFGLLIAAAVIW